MNELTNIYSRLNSYQIVLVGLLLIAAAFGILVGILMVHNAFIIWNTQRIARIAEKRKLKNTFRKCDDDELENIKDTAKSLTLVGILLIIGCVIGVWLS